ncbi:MAG: sulfotransferase [Proteobacteria bacterium]|nr:sulfotransferase [Pseudomonadota bacterium]
MDNREQRSRPRNLALIIGAMKCGTTSLFRILAQHPEIAPSREKEPEFFSDEAIFACGMDWYLDLWEWDPARHKIALEASTGYSKTPFRPGVAKRISEVENAKFRFIYMMRNPVDRIVSHTRHGLYEDWSESLDEGITEYMIDVTRYAIRFAADLGQASASDSAGIHYL